MTKSLSNRITALTLLLALFFTVNLWPHSTSAQNGLFTAAIEDIGSGLCAVVGAYNNFVTIEFSPPGDSLPFKSYDAHLQISGDTLVITEEEEDYSASYSVRYKEPFTAVGHIIYQGVSYTLRDENTKNSFCNGQGTQFNIPNSSSPPAPPPPPPPASLQVTASGPLIGFAPLNATFTASANKPSSFIWKDNGLQFGAGQTASLMFATPSTHTITVTATSGNETASASLTVQVLQASSGGNGNNGNGN